MPGFNLPAFQYSYNYTNTTDHTLAEHTVTFSDIQSALSTGLFIIPLMAYLESISIAKGFAVKNNYKVDATQELVMCRRNSIRVETIFSVGDRISKCIIGFRYVLSCDWFIFSNSSQFPVQCCNTCRRSCLWRIGFTCSHVLNSYLRLHSFRDIRSDYYSKFLNFPPHYTRKLVTNMFLIEIKLVLVL